MNLKVAKHLRKMARQMSFDPQTGKSLPARRLMVDPRHEKQLKAGERKFPNITAVNDPQTTRGVYRWLKKEWSNEQSRNTIRSLGR